MSNQKEELTFKWGIDADAFRRQLTRINADVKNSTDTIKGNLAAAFTVSAAALAFRDIAEKMVELKRKSEDLGVSIESLQAIEKLGVKFGGSVEQTDNALQKLVVAIGNARTEGGAMAESFSRFGVDLYNTNGTAKTTEQVFKSIADAYRNSSDAATKAALAFEFFGRTGKDINNILDMGSEALDEYTKAQVNMTLISEQTVNSLASSWMRLKQESGGTINWMINRFADLASSIGIVIDVYGALMAGLSRREAVQFAQNEFIRPNAQAATDTAAREADAALRAAKQREQLAKATQSIVDLSNQGAEIAGKQKLIGLTIQELALRGRLLSMPMGSKLQAQAERDLLAIVSRRAEAERTMENSKLKLLEMEERQIRNQIDRETDILKLEQLQIELQKKKNEIAAQGNAIEERKARIFLDQNRIQAEAVALKTRAEESAGYSLFELATANIPGLIRKGAEPQVIADAEKAKQVAKLVGTDPNKLGGLAEAARMAGKPAEVQRLVNQADAIKATMVSLKSTEKFNEIAESMRKNNLELKELNRRAAAEGIVVRPVLAR